MNEKLLRIVRNAKGDDLERAEAAFRHYSEAQMNELYGESGQTRKQILEGYQRERNEWQMAYNLLQELQEQCRSLIDFQMGILTSVNEMWYLFAKAVHIDDQDATGAIEQFLEEKEKIHKFLIEIK